MERATCKALSCSSEPRRDAVDRQEQRRPGVFLPGPITPQQLDLLPAHLIEYRQAALEAAAGMWGTPGEGAGGRGPAGHVRGAGVLLGHQREKIRAPPGVPQPRRGIAT